MQVVEGNPKACLRALLEGKDDKRSPDIVVPVESDVAGRPNDRGMAGHDSISLLAY